MLFHYNTLTVKLFPLTKSLKVYFKETHFSKEMLFELEGLFAWLANHIEVNSVLFSSNNETFCLGYNAQEMMLIDTLKLQTYYERIQKLTHTMSYLPQTIIVNLKNGARCEGAEFALGADIIIGSNDAYMQFNHLSEGRSPQCGGIGILKSKVGLSRAKSWILLENIIKASELMNCGILCSTYNQDSINDKNNNSVEETILTQINQQSPSARIQTKRALLEASIGELENSNVYESIFAKATLSGNDWKEYINSSSDKRSPEFKNARDVKA